MQRELRTTPYALRTKKALLFLSFLFCLSGCDVFSARTPEEPVDEAGTFLQPDTPEQVIENIRFAVTELNTPNYTRSLSMAFTFSPTESARAQDETIWTGWSTIEENQYFSTLVAAAEFAANHELSLSDQTISVITDDRFEIDASYVITINHNRPDVPTIAQGRLIWVITQQEDGLWGLTEWTDREIGNEPSWSDLKAEFIK